ncbi:MAG: TIGR03086 family metal-binding protein [Actinomycetota bacterium]
MDPLKSLEGAFDRTGQMVEALRPEDRDLPTPCAEWDVHALLAHLVGVIAAFEDVASGDEPEVPVTDLPPHLQALGEERIKDGPVDGYRDTARRTLAAWQQRGSLDGTVFLPMGFGMPADGAIVIVTLDALVHGWDLGRAIGADTEIDPALAEAALEAAQGFVSDQLRGTAFGAAIDVPADASPTDRLVAFLGRRP